MKYLDNPNLTQLSTLLSQSPSPELRVNVRFEAYSVKPIGKEKKMFKEFEEAYVSEQEEMAELSFSPEMKEAGLSSCFGRLDEKESRKVHFLLVSTLNSAFPDNDFSSLRPDQFTREQSAGQVLSHLSGQLLGPAGASSSIMGPGGLMTPPSMSIGLAPASASASFSSSPSGPSSSYGVNPEIYRVLNGVVPLEECEAYSWFPEPEYDPHTEADDSEVSDDGYEGEESAGVENMDMDMDEPSWGQGGMEMDDVPTALPSDPRRRQSVDAVWSGGAAGFGQVGRAEDSFDTGVERRTGGLLWSANYFFYSKRQKRVLFLTYWCRKRPALTSLPDDEKSLPLPLSTSLNAAVPSITPASFGAIRRTVKSHSRPIPRPIHHRRSKQDLRAGDLSSTIPIRGMDTSSTSAGTATPRASRLAKSAPSAVSPIHLVVPSPSTSMAKMTAGGYRPRQTPARTLKYASTGTGTGVNAEVVGSTTKTSTSTGGPVPAPASSQAEDDGRVRKERSESTTPVPTSSSSARSGLGKLVDRLSSATGAGAAKGKRMKVGTLQQGVK